MENVKSLDINLLTLCKIYYYNFLRLLNIHTEQISIFLDLLLSYKLNIHNPNTIKTK